MTIQKIASPPRGMRTSPWLIMAVAVILLIILTILTIRNINREREFMSKYLFEKGTALIKSFEAGTRIGMMGMMWGNNQVQFLLEETAHQPGIVYLMVTSTTGKILAHNNRERINDQYFDKTVIQTLKSPKDKFWRIRTLDNNRRIFEVYQYFRPIDKSIGRQNSQALNHRMSGMMMGKGKQCCSSIINPDNNDRIIYIGFDMDSFEEAQKVDIRNTIIISLTLLLLGVGGYLSVNYAQRYLITHKSLEDTSWFSNEMVSSLPIGLIATDNNNKIVFFNLVAEKTIGIPLKKIKGKTPKEVFSENMPVLQEYLEEGQTRIEEEVDCLNEQNKTIPLSISTAKILNKTGQFLGNILTFRNLNEIRELQKEIQQKEKLAALGNLAAGVAHEIRNPLSSIKGMAGFLRGKFAHDSEDWNSAGILISETERLNRVVSQLLDFAKPSELQVKQENLNDILEHSINLIKQDAASNQVNIKWNRYKGLPLVLVDRDRFSQCLLNLYLNAVQAMENGGTLSIDCIPKNSDSLQLMISDTGTGIKTGNFKKIFDPYFTLKSTGTGLGLSIVRKIIEEHNGNISVQSVLGKGTAFTITIPIPSDNR